MHAGSRLLLLLGGPVPALHSHCAELLPCLPLPQIQAAPVLVLGTFGLVILASVIPIIR